MSIDADIILAIMKFFPEFVWRSAIRAIPLEKLKNKAYLSAKALLRLVIQRKCIGHDSNGVVSNLPNGRFAYQPFSPPTPRPSTAFPVFRISNELTHDSVWTYLYEPLHIPSLKTFKARFQGHDA